MCLGIEGPSRRRRTGKTANPSDIELRTISPMSNASDLTPHGASRATKRRRRRSHRGDRSAAPTPGPSSAARAHAADDEQNESSREGETVPAARPIDQIRYGDVLEDPYSWGHQPSSSMQSQLNDLPQPGQRPPTMTGNQPTYSPWSSHNVEPDPPPGQYVTRGNQHQPPRYRPPTGEPARQRHRYPYGLGDDGSMPDNEMNEVSDAGWAHPPTYPNQYESVTPSDLVCYTTSLQSKSSSSHI
jgi:hypothetical protein